MIRGRSKRGRNDRISPYAFRKAANYKKNYHNHRCAICEASKHLDHVDCTVHKIQTTSIHKEEDSPLLPPPPPSLSPKSPTNLNLALSKQEERLREEFKKERETFQKEQEHLRGLVDDMSKELKRLRLNMEESRMSKDDEKHQIKTHTKTAKKKNVETTTTTTTVLPATADKSALQELERRVIDRIDKCFEQQQRQYYYEEEEEEEGMILDADNNDLIIIVPNEEVRILSNGRSMVRVPADRAKQVVAEIVETIDVEPLST
jgi:hypothetical protein